MKLYNECFDGVTSLLENYPYKKLDLGSSWSDIGQNQMIFQKDTAFELGGGNLPAISSLALTDSSQYVPCDEVILCGKDLSEIKEDTPFARIALVRVNESKLGTGNSLYQSIRKIEYTRYHINPEGYMMRISSFSHREAVRVSKKAIKNGLDFSKVGKAFIDAYHNHPAVEAVKIIFITDTAFPYKELSNIMEKSENITKALDHLMKDLKMDCDVCKLKDVCEEVEQLSLQENNK